MALGINRWIKAQYNKTFKGCNICFKVVVTEAKMHGKYIYMCVCIFLWFCTHLEISDPKNDLGPFMVTLQQCDSLSFYGPCQLEIQPDTADKIYCVAVYDMNQPPRLVIKWQIDHLRGYGSNESVLKIQTGR